MTKLHFIFRILITIHLALIYHSAHADNEIIKLEVFSDSPLPVYSGPGRYYRPLPSLPPHTQVSTAAKTITSTDGEYYKIRVNENTIGYILKSPDVRRIGEANTNEEYEHYEDLPVSSINLEVETAFLRSGLQQYSIGRLRYFGSGFHYKSWLGGWKTQHDRLNVNIGLEVGIHSEISTNWRAGISLSTGLFLTPRPNSLFVGSREDFTNFLFESALSFRRKIWKNIAVTLGILHTTALNNNNSVGNWGPRLSLQWGMGS